MLDKIHVVVTALLLCVAISTANAAAPKVDDKPASPGEWGTRPAEDQVVAMTPPSFAWRPQKNAVYYTLWASRSAGFTSGVYKATGLKYNVHRPSQVFRPGQWYWRFRFTNRQGKTSAWSKRRSFIVKPGVPKFALPTRDKLLGRIPDRHPRLLLRPEQLPKLRAAAQGKLKPIYNRLVTRCEQLLKHPPDTTEPQKYPAKTVRGSDPWRKIWWGNRTYTIKVLNSAATLAFVYQLDGNKRYAKLAKKLLLAAAEWDPVGSTGYRYNDEAGMPYAYYFARTYSFLHDQLTEAEREKCRQVLTVRGREMYRHLSPRHLWRPYSSHSNRAWHFLGEVGIALHGEVDEADDWTWFAMNVFANVYPVWCDDDGGWHEGINYGSSYIGRFTWWADAMKAAMNIDAYQLPYFSKAGDLPLYLMPPGTNCGGFGDLAYTRGSRNYVSFMATLAIQSKNPYWQWYVQAHQYQPKPNTYIDFIRSVHSPVAAKSPAELPTSKLFRGTGLAVLNTTLLDGRKNISLLFKSSPFGTQSHGFEANNAFQLCVNGDPILIRTGQRDSYGSLHHRNWMWHTKSVNSILVNGEGQHRRSSLAHGRITLFHNGPTIDYVEGEAGEAYINKLERFTRGVLFIKPDILVIVDYLEATKPSTFQWMLHSPNEMTIHKGQHVTATNGRGACEVRWLVPQSLKISQTDQFDPPPRPRVKLTQYHLTATTVQPQKKMLFITTIHPYAKGSQPIKPVKLTKVGDMYQLHAPLKNGHAVVTISKRGLSVKRFDTNGKEIERYTSIKK